jgi:membrane fusion protein (multidrug efflux system)
MAGDQPERDKVQDEPSPQTNQPARERIEEKPASRTSFQKSPVFWIAALLLILAAGGTVYWLYSRGYEETDDAFVDGEIVQVSAKVAGLIQGVEVQDNQDVAAGTVLVRIDPRDFQAALDKAEAALEAAQAKREAARTNVELIRANTEAALAQAQAGVERAGAAIQSSRSQLASSTADVTAAEADAVRRQADLKRYKSLDPRATSQQQLDAAQAEADASSAKLIAARMRAAAAEDAVAEAQAAEVQAQATLAVAKTGPQQVAVAMAQEKNAQADVDEAAAAVEEAKLNLSYTTIAAPVAGRVTRRTARQGQYLQTGQIVLSLVEPEVWVTANFKETQLAHMRAGQDVDVAVDSYPGRTFHGKIDSIQAGSGARFSLLPPENATGNYVKVVQRVPVKIVLDAEVTKGWLLAPGMSVIPRVHVGGDRQHPAPITPPAVHPVSE